MNTLYKNLQPCPFWIAILCIAFLGVANLSISTAQQDEILAEIENETRASNTDALVLIRDGKIIFQYWPS